MAQHATKSIRNAKGRLFVHAAALSLTGAPVMVYQGQGAHRERVPADGAWIRWSVESLPSIRSGRWDSDEVASREAVLLIADLFYPVALADAYAIDQDADELVDALELLSLSFLDYRTTPASPATSSSRLRVLEPPAVQALPTADAYDRRRVTATVTWISRFTA